MRIKHKKTGWEGSVDNDGWEALKRAKLDKNYNVIDKSEGNATENVDLPEVIKFKGRLQEKQKAQQAAGQKTELPGEQAAGETKIN